ncbi:MAG: succinate dehydrogenase assembly factor 2 [Alphaproteobacteria bacterium]|nr:succinate dehydrogenase assembly factor 2 [Alphaproteobacteria bacterium]
MAGRTKDLYIGGRDTAKGTDVSSSSEIRRKRLLFHSWHRGTRESDLILGRFAQQHLARFDEGQLDRYEALLGCSDADLFDWVCGRSTPPPEHDHDVTRLLVSFSSANPHLPCRADVAGPLLDCRSGC